MNFKFITKTKEVDLKYGDLILFKDNRKYLICDGESYGDEITLVSLNNSRITEKRYDSVNDLKSELLNDDKFDRVIKSENLDLFEKYV